MHGGYSRRCRLPTRAARSSKFTEKGVTLCAPSQGSIKRRSFPKIRSLTLPASAYRMDVYGEKMCSGELDQTWGMIVTSRKGGLVRSVSRDLLTVFCIIVFNGCDTRASWTFLPAERITRKPLLLRRW